MATIVYLDADDEITSAASRIRSAGDGRVGLVLPFGSRVATSRINFRLLAREAAANGRRLDIVAPDASARALAASAGLAVYGSVGEYEAALDADEDAAATTPVPPGIGAAGIGAAGIAGAAAGGGDGRPIDPSRDTVPTQRVRVPITEPASSDDAAPGVAAMQRRVEPQVDARAVRERGGRRGPGRALFAALLVIVLVGAGGAFAAVNVLPTATITVTPRYEDVGPVTFTVTADPDATAVDTTSATIPASAAEIPVAVSGTFPATGKKIVKEKAKGVVRFTNCDPSAAYRIPAGTTVATGSGTQFATSESVLLPVAGLSGNPPNLRVRCTMTDVGVSAVVAGTAGNVGAGEIRIVPARYNRSLVRVTNPEATTGGTREVFPKISQEDVDGALATLRTDAQARFQELLADPTTVPGTSTVFPDTAVLGDLAPDTDPAMLVDREVESFTLGVTGTGTVLTVDSSPIEAIAEARLADAVADGHELVPDSTRVQVGEGTAADGLVSFDVDATALQLRTLDPDALRAAVLGRSKAEAEAALAQFGDVTLTLWPDFVTAVPASEGRVTVTVVPPPAPDLPAPTPTPTPRPTARPADEPSGGVLESPADEVPTEPVPSG